MRAAVGRLLLHAPVRHASSRVKRFEELRALASPSDKSPLVRSSCSFFTSGTNLLLTAACLSSQSVVVGEARLEVTAGLTTARDVARMLRLQAEPALAVLDGIGHWDAGRALPPSATPLRLQLLSEEDAWSSGAREVFLHSAAHVLGSALEATFGPAVQLADGPALPSSG
jgi:hypothetical protein